MPFIEKTGAGHRERLREKYLKSSLAGFHDYEALELLLTFAIPRRDVKPLAKALLSRFRSIGGVLEASGEDLLAVTGVGGNAATFIALLRELAGAYLNEESSGKRAVRSAKDILDFLALNSMDAEERFVAVYLNSKNEILGAECLQNGKFGKAKVSPRNVIGNAFKHNARSIIFVHTRYDAAPSSFERRLIKELEGSAASIDIIVHDYIKKGDGCHFSAREAGWLKGD